MASVTRLYSFVLACALLSAPASAQKRPFTFEEMMKVKRVADPQLSPDGKWVTFTVTSYDVASNSRNSDIWLVPSAGGEPRQMTRSPKADERARWAPDSKRFAFVSTRSGTSQIWILTIDAGEALLVDTRGVEASGVVWSPDGKNLAFASDVYPDCQDLACNQKKEKEREASPVKARLLDKLMFRHWNAWKDGKRSHVFVVPTEGGTPKDLTPGDADAPPFSLGGPDDYVFSPDGKELCFVRNNDRNEAISTNSDLFVVAVDGKTAARKLTTNLAADSSPTYSPDGKFIAFRAQARAGFESDRWRLMLYDRTSSTIKSLTESFDRHVESFLWTPDSKALFLIAGDEARQSVFSVDLNGGPVRKVLDSHTIDDVQLSPDARKLVFSHQSLSTPAEIFSAGADGSELKALTAMNRELVSQVDLQKPESVVFTGAGGAKVQTWILKPPGFDPAKRYPLLLAIHGGPQGVWGDAMSYRWNGQVFAAQGYVVMMPNPRGSTTFGQQFVDEIRDDWGGKVYEDLMKGVDHVLTLGYVDSNRMAAAGGSYGGYMANWMAGHTDRFKCLISHAGVFDLTSMFGVTEELWFPEWEFKGTPWTNRETYEKWSPHHFAKNFKTPMLVIHGELDFRVPIGEGFQLFSYLQRLGVPSKMLYFPDEGHWILKPANSQLWYKTFLEWLGKHLQ
ncbi:MAG TPA: S9 family peptidase [Terriglobia bacterium]|nr:S9 family peptidase [Terriglobia bacterium]